MGENSAIANIAEELTGFDIRPLETGKGVALETKSLWRFICLLFLDSNPGFCANPDCPAPYFLKHRKTQKFCDLGPCTEYAQRRYALKWWHENRAQRRRK
jgi:hypothetical protein